MFLKQLYQYNKYGWAAFLFFVIAFFYINIKWGVVATPVYQFGMFSGTFHVSDTQHLYEIWVDGKKINTAEMHFTQRDMLFTMIERYQNASKLHPQIAETLQHLYRRAGLGFLNNDKAYQQGTTDKVFAQWCLQYLKLPQAKRLQVMQSKYIWHNKAMLPVSTAQPTSIDTQ